MRSKAFYQLWWKGTASTLGGNPNKQIYLKTSEKLATQRYAQWRHCNIDRNCCALMACTYSHIPNQVPAHIHALIVRNTLSMETNPTRPEPNQTLLDNGQGDLHTIIKNKLWSKSKITYANWNTKNNYKPLFGVSYSILSKICFYLTFGGFYDLSSTDMKKQSNMWMVWSCVIPFLFSDDWLNSAL